MAAVVFWAVAPAYAEKRIALVIGNDRYVNLAALQKAGNDADSVRGALARLGFQVIHGRDLGRQGMIDKLAEFTARVEAGDTALFFYAGHGIAIGGVNYLVPTDAPAATAGAEARVRGGSIAESDIIAEIQAKGARVAVLVLDACRDNPFPRIGTRTVGNTRGLAESKPARGVFSIYSAGIGQTALDRLGPDDRNLNSVFTTIFVEQLAKPSLHLGELAVEVRERVAAVALTARNEKNQPEPHEQTPAYYDQTIGGRVYLAARPPSVEQRQPEPRAAQPSAAQSPDPATQAWSVMHNTTSIAVLEDFIRQFGATAYGSMARARIEELKRASEKIQPQVSVVAPRAAPPAPSPVQPAVGSFPGVQEPDAMPLAPERERRIKPKDTFKECDVCPEMVVVPAGSFIMGSSTNDPLRRNDEGPQHQVTIARPFAVGKFAVTFEQWKACVADGGCDDYRSYDQGSGQGKHPATGVSWSGATKYLAWLSNKTGRHYRLLTEAEREYVTRAGTTTPFWWGSTISTHYANYDGTRTGGENRKRTLPVDSFSPNPFGLYQVHGNVWEWVEDVYNPTYTGAPTDGSAWTSGDLSRRVLRGGSWVDDSGDLRSARRQGLAINNQVSDVGFRVARTLGP